MSNDFLKSLYYEILSYFVVEKIQYKTEGHCVKCGKCCQEICSPGLKNEKDLKLMSLFFPYYKNFYISGRAEDGSLLLACKRLNKNMECEIYNKRPRICRNYPAKILPCNMEMFEGCGYKIINKKFKDYLKAAPDIGL